MRVFRALSRRRPLQAAVIALLALAAGWVWHATRRHSLNVLLITLDTTRADRLGAWGGPEDLTPVLDELASRSVVFSQAYAPVPLTLPSHVSMMTGLYPPEHGLRVNSGLHRLGLDVPVLAELLHEQEYRTGAFVGAFVLDRKFGLDRGFEIYDDEMEESHGPTPGDPHGHKMRIGERVVDAALTWLNHAKHDTFFCWVHLFDPHTPYLTRPELFGERFQDRPYDAGIAYVDLQVERLLEFLRQNGLDENTLVVVVGDHGESLGEHQERTHGFFVYDATLHVPLIMRWPEPTLPPRKIETPISLIDLFPTLLATVGIEPPAECSGRSLAAACRGDALAPLPLYAESNHPLEECGAAPLRCLIDDRWKYIRSPRPELYDLEADPAELQNVYAGNPDIAAALERRLQEQESSLVLRDAPAAVISPHEKRMLASLGYAGGGATTAADDKPRPDIKDAIGYYNLYCDAQDLIGRQEFDAAARSLSDVVEVMPNFFQAWFNLGYCRQMGGDLPAAEAAYRRAVEIDSNATALTSLANIYLNRDKTQEAISHLEAAIEMQPDMVRAVFLLGDAYRRQERWAEARTAYRKALELAPDFHEAREALASLPD